MKSLSLLAIALAIGLLVIHSARGLPGSERPPGVREQAWVPMGDAAGFVATGDSSSRNAQKQGSPNLLGPPQLALRGYFVVKRGSAWYRVDTAPDPSVMPADGW